MCVVARVFYFGKLTGGILEGLSDEDGGGGAVASDEYEDDG